MYASERAARTYRHCVSLKAASQSHETFTRSRSYQQSPKTLIQLNADMSVSRPVVHMSAVFPYALLSSRSQKSSLIKVFTAAQNVN